MPEPAGDKRWSEPPPESPETALPDFHPLIRRALARRGFFTPETARSFLEPAGYSPAPASDLPGMNVAAARLRRAVAAGDRICVWGDFDVDGQTATAILVDALEMLGADVMYHVPARAVEGHGVHPAGLSRVIDDGARLVLTCDTGITAHAAVELARSRGVEMVITDHHDLSEGLPAATAVVDPKMLPQGHPLGSLAGAGVAFKLAEALLGNRTEPLLDLAALGLIGDLALLRDDTRYLVQRGLEALRHTGRLGLRTMMELAQVSGVNLNEEHIGFELAPRLNALGRLGDANPGVELLLTSDAGRARVIATQLEGYNAQRRLLEKQVYQAAEAMLEKDPSLLTRPVIILDDARWTGGVIGLAASRLARRYGKPAIVFTSGEGGLAHGSARSIEGVNITEAISAQGALLRSFGGHPMAAGLSLRTADLPQFRRQMYQTLANIMDETEASEPTVEIDGWLTLPELSLDLARQIEQLAPFGPGNPKLLLASRNLKLKSASLLGREGEHLRLAVEDESGNTQVVLWWGGADEAVPDGPFDLVYTLRAADFRGAMQLTAELVDWRYAEGAAVVLPQSVEVLDWRRKEEKEERLNELLAGRGEEVLVWSEAGHQKAVGGRGRDQLRPANTLVVWTAPPSPALLREALQCVGPKLVVLVGADPEQDEPQAFLERLAGLAKFAIRHRGGQATWEGLAAATSQTEVAVQLGLEWLVQRGQLVCEPRPDGGIQLALSQGGRSSLEGEAPLGQLERVLAETAAYRAFFMRAEKPVE